MYKRKQISKKVRRQVLNKYKGHCAYCGCSISYKTMQIDHVVAIYKANYESLNMNINAIGNLMPACKECNHYKGALSIEGFRERLNTILDRVRQPFIVRLAEKYKMVKIKTWDGKFYFEKQGN